jgi:hypothetical protein
MRTLAQLETLGDWIIDRDHARAAEAEERETDDERDTEDDAEDR